MHIITPHGDVIIAFSDAEVKALLLLAEASAKDMLANSIVERQHFAGPSSAAAARRGVSKLKAATKK